MPKSLTAPRLAAVLATPLLLLTACTAGDETVKVPLERIVGQWQGPDGEKLTLSTDRTFTSSGLHSGKLADTQCPDDPAKGGWGFMTDSGNSSFASKTATSGSWIGLGFERKHWACILQLAVVDGGTTLCATDDPDIPCGLDVRFTRQK